MGFTTPDKPVDMAGLFPELAGQARTSVRLHPRQGATTWSIRTRRTCPPRS